VSEVVLIVVSWATSMTRMLRCTLAVRVGSFATDRCAMKIGLCPQCPESDGWPSRRRPSRWAKPDSRSAAKHMRLFDHLVGARQQHSREGDPEGFRGLGS